jgi:hypothetical protein
VTNFQKGFGKLLQRLNGFIFLVGPEEGLLEMVSAVIGVIFGINAVTDNKDLNILEQATATQNASRW